MTAHDGDRPGGDGLHRSAPAGRPRIGRRQAVAGVIGLAAVLGGGSYLLTTHLAGGQNNTATSDVGAVGDPSALSSAAPSGSAAATPTAAAQAVSPGPASAAATTPSAKAPAANPVPTDAAKVKKEVQEAREKAAKDGVSLQRPLTAKGGPIDGLSTRTEKTADGTIRITTAKSDLTGRQDQLMAADAGKAVGHARCTQKLHFSNADAREIPTVLLCWRTSDSRSVVTLAISTKGKPSAASSAAVIDREWARLG